MTTDRYAVMGNPIGHSKSPRIHRLFAAATGQTMDYSAILVEPGRFAAAVAEFRAGGGKGLNITVPFKQEAWALADLRSPRAELAGAVNTLHFRPAGLYGDNTDGVGLVRDLCRNQGVTLAGRNILVLGAGGAVRGVLGPLLAERPARVLVANRTVAKGEALAQLFAEFGPISAVGFDALAAPKFDVIINGTSASLHGELPPLPPGSVAGACCYDMMYGREATPFMHWGAANGAARTIDGLGMLVEQAAESFLLWRGVRPETAAVIRQVRAEL